MGEQQDITTSPLMQELEKNLPKMNFYRFCQLLEQLAYSSHQLGCAESPAQDHLRFAPVSAMGFPAGELKAIERDPYLPERPTTVRTTFLGLYGVDAIMPYAFLDDIIKREEGYEALTDFLDIFNHRVITQYYRIWLKYHYPSSYVYGGEDNLSQCLLGLTGLGIKGTSEQIATPPSRFLALLGLITQHTRTAEGIVGLIRVLAPNVEVKVSEFYPIWVNAPQPASLSQANKVALNGSAVVGKRFKESNQTIKVVIIPNEYGDVEGVLPDGQVYHDIMVLLRAYLGYRVDVRLSLHIKRALLPRTTLFSAKARLGQTASLAKQVDRDDSTMIEVNIGEYRGLAA